MLEIDPGQQTRQLRPFAAPMTRKRYCLSGFRYVGGQLVILIGAFVVLFH
jgi:hypothetical protein